VLIDIFALKFCREYKICVMLPQPGVFSNTRVQSKGRFTFNPCNDSEDTIAVEKQKIAIMQEKKKLDSMFVGKYSRRKITFMQDELPPEIKPVRLNSTANNTGMGVGKNNQNVRAMMEQSRAKMQDINAKIDTLNTEINTAELNHINSNHLYDETSCDYIDSLQNNISQNFMKEKEYGNTNKVVKKDSCNERKRVTDQYKASNKMTRMTLGSVIDLDENELNNAQIKLDTLRDDTNVRNAKYEKINAMNNV
jgi:hypothetical protein